ncbi:PleD family two-component system response regulator [Caballeronia sp. S22]|uniref:response regulator n=1 Tax=Caballeronia sp. S22 TaxID=3137182 RepID=UPI0035314C94
MRKVLLVDDDQNTRDAMSEILAVNGYSVIVADDGLTGLEAAACRPNLIVSDIDMAEVQGPHMVRILRALPEFALMPIILMSGAVDIAPIPVEGMLRKPVDPRHFLDLVNHLAASAPIGEAEPRVLQPATLPSGTSQRCDAVRQRIRRGIVLWRYQEKRILLLAHLRADTGLSEQLSQNLLLSVAGLVRLYHLSVDWPEIPACARGARE